jgi:nucleotidyltransferase/DNA polymerase involved in DNA repair
VARLYGVRSAMPMLKALAACPDAELIRPDMAKYSEIGRAVRAETPRPTPLVEPVSCLASVNSRPRYGRIGTRMARLARGEDERTVNAGALAHSISAESPYRRTQRMRRP